MDETLLINSYINQLVASEDQIEKLEQEIKNIESTTNSFGTLVTENNKLKYQIQLLEKNIALLKKSDFSC